MGEDRLSAIWVWEDILERFDKTEAARVSWIEHAPLSDVWNKLDMKDTVAEMSNHVYSKDESRGSSKDDRKSVWFVKIIQSAGYFVKVRLLGYPESQADDVAASEVWVHYCELKELGNHRTSPQLQVMPPIDVDSSREECKNRLCEEMIGKLSVHAIYTHEDIINRGFKNRWAVGHKVEVRDQNCVSQMKLGFIKKIRGGRLMVSYWDSKSKDKDMFWVHEESEFIKPLGWSHASGGKLNAPDHYKPPLLDESQLLQTDLSIPIEEGMFFEMIHPIRLNEIAAARVTKVLSNGYFRCRLDCSLADVDLQEFLHGENEFHLHVSSTHIFPCGTCAEYGQALSAPASVDNDGNQRFSWEVYFNETGYKPLPLPTKHADPALLNLKRGMWIEAVDSHVTEMVCPANIHDIMGPYAVKVRFPGWTEAYDQWKPLGSTELFPIGWSQLVKLNLAPPGTEIKTYDHIFTYEDKNKEEDHDKEKDHQETKQSEPNKRKRRGRPPTKRVLAPTHEKSISKTASSSPKKSPKKREVRKRKSSFSQLDSDGESFSLDEDSGVASTPKAVKARKTTVKKEGGRGKRARVDSNISDCESEYPSISGDDSSGDPHSIRRSSRSRQAPTFFGENVDTRHINLIL